MSGGSLTLSRGFSVWGLFMGFSVWGSLFRGSVYRGVSVLLASLYREVSIQGVSVQGVSASVGVSVRRPVKYIKTQKLPGGCAQSSVRLSFRNRNGGVHTEIQ